MDLLYKRDKTAADVECLLEQHKNLVYYMLTKTEQLGNQDAESAAWEALWDAINVFSVYEETQFSTFACTMMRNAINDVLRKQNRIRVQENEIVAAYIEANKFISEFEPHAGIQQRVIELFKEYVSDKRGNIRSILLAWYGTGFENSATNIANMCKCSVSYVCRTQQLFRAFLKYRLEAE